VIIRPMAADTSLFFNFRSLMYYCVAYDIAGNRLRRLVVKWCKQAGLRRLQRSVFAGRSTAARIAALEQDVHAVLPPTDRFVVVSLDRAAWRKIRFDGQAPDDLIFGQTVALRFF
jgi:CRISPR-associated protein Cas2